MIKNFFSKLSLIDLIFILYLPAIFILSLKTIPNNPNVEKLFLLYFVLYIGLFIIIYIRGSKFQIRIINYIMFLYPVIFLFIIFESLGFVIPYFTSTIYDEFFSNLDNFIFSQPPSILLESIVNPLLTEVMYIFYFLYFPIPIVLIITLLISKEYKKMEEAYFIYLICYFGAYLIFFLLPVYGPRIYLHDEYSVLLNGLFFSQYITSIIDKLEPNRLDCFPSLHCAIMIVTAFLSYRFNKKFFYIILPVITIILFSLIYCRYHYFLDIAAGVIWAVLSYLLAVRLYSIMKNKFSYHFRI
jgi:membrane-associated phospholipid phosphatase